MDKINAWVVGAAAVLAATLYVNRHSIFWPFIDNSAACLEYVEKNATRGDPASVIAAIDEFTKTRHMMNVGKHKGAVVDEEIRKKKPLIMVELGGYTGYSAVRFASLQRAMAGDKKSHYFSFEYSPVYAERIRKMVEFAGLADQVTVVEGAFSEKYQLLKDKTVDLYFIDHDKRAYLSDVKLIINSGTLAKGSVLTADNVIIPGAPDYLEFVENHPQFNTIRHYAQLGNGPLQDAISVAVFKG